MKYKIVGIHKNNGDHYDPHTAIDAYIYETGDKKYYKYRQDMVNRLKNGDSAYVPSPYGNAECVVRNNGRIEFLQTVSDGRYTNNLLSLPEYNIS